MLQYEWVWVCGYVCVCAVVGVTIHTFDDGSAVQECVPLRAQRVSSMQQASHKEAEVLVAVVERWRGGWDRGWWGI